MHDLTFAAEKSAEFQPGSVWLVGAGPGDPGLLTLHAARAIRAADVILYDALVNTEVLAEARRGALLTCVGRRKGNEPVPHAETIRMMIEHAKAGRRVVRLKGGDPCVFGRGGEEAAALAAAEVPFRIVPGITAGIGGLAYAGISATHRGAAQAVTLLTAHGADGELPDDLDWKAMAGDGHALVVYMGVSALGGLVAGLLAHGRDHRTPVAIIARATTPQQRVLQTTLGEAELASQRADLGTPALIVIGKIADPALATPWFQPKAKPARIFDRELLGALTA